MSFKRSTTSMTLALIALSIISITSIQQNAFAQETGMSVSAIAAEGSDTIAVSGHTMSQITDITFTVISPSLNVISVGQLTPDANGDFATEFKVSPIWKESGFYTIKVEQSPHGSSLYKASLRVEIINGKTSETDVTESNLETGFFEPKPTERKGLLIKESNAIAGSNIITIMGTTDSANSITIKVMAPNGNVVVVDQFAPILDTNNHFLKDITTGGPLWNQDGQYTIVAQQGDDPKYKYSIEVGIKDGVVIPEFGTIAVMILAVAIISIIAVSAKSRLSIMPR
ncbi:MAG: PEFG-CTERM sorting domain-containing protein, partial [Nitrosarchaeum sp.]|nr:PEFG-CTERM sorting domain-containing protein [Nitrosarchaeum sp.]